MTLKELGFNEEIEKSSRGNELKDFVIGRVVSEHKDRYIVGTENGELEAEITGNLRFSAGSRADLPAVGDWVALTICDSDFSVIHQILPRVSVISRQAVGQYGEIQVLAANVDCALIVFAVDRDFNINRLERYLTICYSSGVSPIVVLTKTDLISAQQVAEIVERVKQRSEELPVVALSNETQDGYEALKAWIEPGKTYCMLGSSGVGKSTLLNNLSGRNVMKTGAISESTNKGRHVTSHRELVVLGNGGILIDNPGMREVGIVDSAAGLETSFEQIAGLSQHCRFKDCTHTNETGCSVMDAMERGEIDRSSYENYLKLAKERSYFESTVVERRKHGRQFGKMVKQYNKDKSKGRY